jgi:hypothetical protein
MPQTRRPGLGALKLLLAAAATGVGASLLFHSTAGSPPALVRPAVPRGAVQTPTIQAAEDPAATGKPDSHPETVTAAGDRDEQPGKDGKATRKRSGSSTIVARTIVPQAGTPPVEPEVPAPPLTPADPAPVEEPEPAPAPPDEPVPPVELPADGKATPPSGGEEPPADPAAPPPPPA